MNNNTLKENKSWAVTYKHVLTNEICHVALYAIDAKQAFEKAQVNSKESDSVWQVLSVNETNFVFPEQQGAFQNSALSTTKVREFKFDDLRWSDEEIEITKQEAYRFCAERNGNIDYRLGKMSYWANKKAYYNDPSCWPAYVVSWCEDI